MMIRIRTVLLSVLVIFLSSSAFSQQSWPSTLLWRISGNGLSKPSYLYGTMHLQDKRLFNFGDSLYHSLEKVEGFALEIDFKEFLDSMFTNQLQQIEKKYLGDDEDIEFDRSSIDHSADSVLKEFGVESNKVNKKLLKKIRSYRMNKIVQQGEMQTTVDGCLYGIALRTGKWIGGIEDINDQLKLIDELGSELNPEKVLAPEKDMRRSLETMINMYVKQDLQALNAFIDGSDTDSAWKDEWLTKRNIKMARRMDSLSAIRTMFFAVGAAHLPGDSGVIRILRNQGFLVEPVYSSQKIAAENYVKKLSAIEWHKIEDKEKLFTVEMPGVASDYNMFGQAMQMKMFYDLTTMTMYLAGNTIGRFVSKNEADQMMDKMIENMGLKIGQVKKRSISKGDIIGIEGTFQLPEGYYTIQLLQRKNNLFMLMAGSNKKKNITTPDVIRFFSSFKASDAVASTGWKKFPLKSKYASILLPGEPKPNMSIDRLANNSPWLFETYDFIDNSKGLYYLTQIRDVRKGYYVHGDSIFFASYVEELGKKLTKVEKNVRELYNGFPSLRFEGISVEEKTTLKTFSVIRGGRVYSLIVAGHQNADFSDAETYFNSLEFQDYPKIAYSRQNNEGFYTSATAPIQKIIADSTDDTDKSPDKEVYYVHSPDDVATYYISKEAVSPYYWYKDEASFFESQIEDYKAEADSLISKEFKSNGTLKSMELKIQSPGNHNIKRMRFFVNGDTIYILQSSVPAQYTKFDHHNKFFEDFRVVKEQQPKIFTAKYTQLFETLKSKDSITFTQAFTAFRKHKFESKHLPLLHDAMLQVYFDHDANHYFGATTSIIDRVEKLADSSTLEFIKTNYQQLKDAREELKYPILRLLTNIHTSASYKLLKQLMLSGLPTKGESSPFAWRMSDSLELTKSLFPEILTLHKDSIFRDELVILTNFMLDSNMISLDMVLPYKQSFLEGAKKQLDSLRKGEEDSWLYGNWIELIGKFNDPASNQLLREFSKVNATDVKYSAVFALIKNNQTVDPKQIEALATDLNYRLQLYEDLKEIKKENLFPLKYINQQSFAEAELFEIANDDYEASEIRFIATKTTEFMGKKQKFYLFQVIFGEESETESYLGVAGPFDLLSKQPETHGKHSSVYWSEEYNKSKLDVQFKAFLKNAEEYLKESEELPPPPPPPAIK